MKICNFKIGLDQPLFLIAGPNVVEEENLMLDTAVILKDITDSLNIPLIFKSSFDKINHSSISNHRRPGIEEGLRILQQIKEEYNIPILITVHEGTPLDEIADVADVLQTPVTSFHQINFIQTVCNQGKPVSIAKGQSLSPQEMNSVVKKAMETGNERIIICEQGSSFGYNDLIVDMRSLINMRESNCPIIFDATNSVQLLDEQDEFISALTKAAVSTGIAGVVLETHSQPLKALSNSTHVYPLDKAWTLMDTLKTIDETVKQRNLSVDS